MKRISYSNPFFLKYFIKIFTADIFHNENKEEKNTKNVIQLFCIPYFMPKTKIVKLH